MARSWHLQFDDLYLTETGANGATWYSVNASGLDALFNVKQGNSTNGADGMPFNENPLTGGKGIQLEFFIRAVDTVPVFQLLQSKMDDLTNDNSECTINGSGEPGSFSIKAIVWHKSDRERPFNFGEFSSGTVKNVALRFQITEIISITKV